MLVRFLDIYQVTQALNTVLTTQKQLAEMLRSWKKVDFESVRNQSALVCNCRHEDLVQLLEVEFPEMMESLTRSTEPVREVMSWADKCCERLMGSSRASHNGTEERSTMSSRSVLIRWGYVTSQVMRDLVSSFFHEVSPCDPTAARQFAVTQRSVHSKFSNCSLSMQLSARFRVP